MSAEPGKLAGIRAVLERFDWERDDRQLALERIEQIATGSRTASGPELEGGAYVTKDDLRTVLDTLDVAADYKRDRAANCPDCDTSPADLCGTCEYRLQAADTYDALAERVTGGQQ